MPQKYKIAQTNYYLDKFQSKGDPLLFNFKFISFCMSDAFVVSCFAKTKAVKVWTVS